MSEPIASIVDSAASSANAASGRTQSAEKLIEGMTEHSREVLYRLERYRDCTIRTSDGIEFRLSKSSLAERSTVLGRMLRELESETEFPISEDSKSVSLLLDVLYSRAQQSPVTMDNVATVLELARKFDVASALDSCDDFLRQQPLSWQWNNPAADTLVDIYAWAAHHHLPTTLKGCRICAKDVFANVLRYSPGEVTTLLGRVPLEEEAHLLRLYTGVPITQRKMLHSSF